MFDMCWFAYLWSRSAFWADRVQRDGQQARSSRLQFYLRETPCSERGPHSSEEASLAPPRALHIILTKPKYNLNYMLTITNTEQSINEV